MKFKTIIFVLIAFAIMAVAQDKYSAVVLKVRGKAMITPRGDDNDPVKLKKGKMLNSGDKITTGNRSFVAIKFLDDATLLRIRSKSEVTVKGEWNDEGKQDKSIFATLGSIWASITRSNSIFSVTTPTAVASVKGTKFWSIVMGDGSSMFIGEEGMVEIANELGTVLMRKGQTTEVGKDAAPVVRRTRDGDVPEDEDSIERYELEFDFENDLQQKKTLIIDIEN